MLEPNRWNYLEFEQPDANRAGKPAASDRSLYLEIEGQERVYTGGLIKSRLYLRLIPEHVARRYQVIPIEMQKGLLKVAMVDPENKKLCSELEQHIRMRILPCRATPDVIQQGLAMYRSDDLSPPVAMRGHRPPSVLPISPWVHTPYRSPARVHWPAHLPMVLVATMLLLTIIVMLLLHPMLLPLGR